MSSLPAASEQRALQALRGRLVVSCQASHGDPLDDTETLTRIAVSVLQGGAGGVRVEGAQRIESLRSKTDLPIIGLLKRQDRDGRVYITPDFKSAREIIDAGADIVALDCTRRRLTEAEPWTEMIPRIHGELGRPVLADIATLEDALAAEAAGADAVASTLYGYTADTEAARTVSWLLLDSLLSRLKIPVILEGHVTQPEEVSRALQAGVYAVVVGAAITCPRSITARFVASSKLNPL
jgi:N-acylglucosamine-6-phosphate 2-epimerase